MLTVAWPSTSSDKLQLQPFHRKCVIGAFWSITGCKKFYLKSTVIVLGTRPVAREEGSSHTDIPALYMQISTWLWKWPNPICSAVTCKDSMFYCMHSIITVYSAITVLLACGIQSYNTKQLLLSTLLAMMFWTQNYLRDILLSFLHGRCVCSLPTRYGKVYVIHCPAQSFRSVPWEKIFNDHSHHIEKEALVLYIYCIVCACLLKFPRPIAKCNCFGHLNNIINVKVTAFQKDKHCIHVSLWPDPSSLLWKVRYPHTWPGMQYAFQMLWWAEIQTR